MTYCNFLFIQLTSEYDELIEKLDSAINPIQAGAIIAQYDFGTDSEMDDNLTNVIHENIHTESIDCGETYTVIVNRRLGTISAYRYTTGWIPEIEWQEVEYTSKKGRPFLRYGDIKVKLDEVMRADNLTCNGFEISGTMGFTNTSGVYVILSDCGSAGIVANPDDLKKVTELQRDYLLNHY